MMIRPLGIVAFALLPPSHGFAFLPSAPQLRRQPCQAQTGSTIKKFPATTRLDMSDFDFPSAMPEKPQLTIDEKVAQSADETIETISKALGEGVEEPPELEALRKARKSGAKTNELALRIYELMIERGMLYDEEPETGTLTPTEFNIKENLDVPEVRDEFSHLYKYGMVMMRQGLVSEDEVKTAVLERLIKRTGLEPEEFDKWLGY
eukprot:scaffold738_cov124-Cylindrotheca_fusiformis.AAC.11